MQYRRLPLSVFGGAALAQSGKTEVLWLGQSAFRITTPGGKAIMIDPWMRTNPKTPANFKDLHAVGRIDLILVTHAHFDHFADAADLAKLNDAPMLTGAGLGSTVVTLGILPAKLAPRFGKSGTARGVGDQPLSHAEVRHPDALRHLPGAGRAARGVHQGPRQLEDARDRPAARREGRVLS